MYYYGSSSSDDGIPKDDMPKIPIPSALDSSNILNLTKKQLKEIAAKKYMKSSDEYLKLEGKVNSAFYYRYNTHHGIKFEELYEELLELLK